MWLSNLVFYSGTGFILIALLFATVLKKTEKPKYFKHIFFIICYGLLLSTNTFFFKKLFLYSAKTGLIVQSTIVILQSISMYLVFYSLLVFDGLKKWIKLLSAVSILSGIAVIIVFILGDVYFPQSIIQNLVVIAFSVFYFIGILRGRPDIVLTKSPAFWLALGMFFWATVSFPIYCLHTFIPFTGEYKEISYRLFSISNVSLIVMYILFIKSYLCLTHQQNLQSYSL